MSLVDRTPLDQRRILVDVQAKRGTVKIIFMGAKLLTFPLRTAGEAGPRMACWIRTRQHRCLLLGQADSLR